MTLKISELARPDETRYFRAVCQEGNLCQKENPEFSSFQYIVLADFRTQHRYIIFAVILNIETSSLPGHVLYYVR